MKATILIILEFLSVNILLSQTIEHPVVHEKSHPTLSILKIEKGENETIFHMQIVNMLAEGGWFCIDKSVKLQIAGKKEEIKMHRSDGLPLCPEIHSFDKTGEELEFRLYFPALPQKILELDLIEDCDDNCFFFKGIVLDNTLNNEIRTFEKGLSEYSKNDFEAALRSFALIRDNSMFKERKHYGYSMFIIPVIYHNSGDTDAAKSAYKALLDTEFTNKEYFISQLHKMDFFKNLSF